ncbi:MAG: hypothetical protein ACE5DX_03050 [Candidatus Dojkabacteria bacterium]
MADDSNVKEDFESTRDSDPSQENKSDYIADDVQSAALGDTNSNPDLATEDDDIPVTSGEMEIGDLDKDSMEGQGDEKSYDEESVPAGDNVLS